MIEVDGDVKRSDQGPWQADVVKAMGFTQTTSGGRSDPFWAHSQSEWRIELATQVRVKIDAEGLNQTDAVYLVAKQMEGVSEPTVRRAWLEFADIVRGGDLDSQIYSVRHFNRQLDESRERNPG